MFLLALALSNPAHATTGLAWKPLPAEGLRYMITARVGPPAIQWFYAEQNKELRAVEYEVELVTTCTSQPLGKTSYELRCEIDDISLGAIPASSEKDLVTDVLVDNAETLKNAWVQIQIGADGHVKNMDLEGVDVSNERFNARQQMMRDALVRAFAAFDMEMPAKGDDKGKAAWRTDDQYATRMPGSKGSMGSVALVHAIREVDAAGIATIESQGKGVISSGDLSSYGQPLWTLEMVYGGEWTFDTTNGWLVERQYQVGALPTAGSAGALGSTQYDQAVRLRLLAPDETPTLLPSGPIGASLFR